MGTDELEALTYLNDFEARTVEAIAERIIPGEGDDAGATEAGVVYYIDRSITGFSTPLQQVYRRGLRELDAYCKRRYRLSFVELDSDQQDELVRAAIGPEVGAPTSGFLFGPEDQASGEQSEMGPEIDGALLHRLFTVIREHTVEGYFCDPAYGGNRNTVGWRLVGFPGAQWGYTAEQMVDGFDASSIPIMTLADLRAQLKDLPPNQKFYTDAEK